MNIGKFLQLICVGTVTVAYLIGGWLCAKSGGLTSVMGVFFFVVGITMLFKTFISGTILKNH